MSRLFFLFETENINAPREIFYSFKPLITETTNMEMERKIYLVPILEYICWDFWNIGPKVRSFVKYLCGTKITLEWITVPHF